MRSIRTASFRYVKNYKLDRVFLQPQYRDREEYTKNLRELYKEGKLSARHKEIYFGERPAEELYNIVEDPEMMVDLANNPSYLKELNAHRVLLQDWLAKGDTGEGEEPIAELKDNGENKKWGEGVNAEYEVYRIDSDGDGLSDKWEALNGRDADDGLLIFSFDCGGWQTEGWYSNDISSNITGFQGFLDFYLDKELGTLKRDHLQLKTTKADDFLEIIIKVSKKIKIDFKANSISIGHTVVKPSDSFQTIKIKLNKQWKGLIEQISLGFNGDKGAFVEIDEIKISRK